MDELITGYRGRVSQDAITEAVQLVTTEFLKTLPQLESA